jgi:hypothetical protein
VRLELAGALEEFLAPIYILESLIKLNQETGRLDEELLLLGDI